MDPLDLRWKREEFLRQLDRCAVAALFDPGNHGGVACDYTEAFWPRAALTPTLPALLDSGARICHQPQSFESETPACKPCLPKAGLLRFPFRLDGREVRARSPL